MATEMAEVSNRVNFGSWVGRLTCPEKSGQHEYPMISGLVRKKRYGIQCPENIGPASTWLMPRGGGLPLWESVGIRRGFAPQFRHLDDLFAPQNLTMSTILFRSCWVPFQSPTFSACRRSFCPPNWPNLSFYSDLFGSRFELRAAHPYWFWSGVPPGH